MSNYTSINTTVPLPAGYDLSYVVQVTPGDFNGDGKLDFILDYELYPLENIAYPIRVMTGDGTGHFTDSTSALFGNNIPAAVMPRTAAVGDFNLDGRPDLYIADTGYDAVPFPGAPNSLILSNGANGLINATNRLPGTVDFTHSVAAVDINGDGFLDIYVGNSANPAPYFLINDGTGHFTMATDRLPASIGGPNGNIYTTNVTIFTTEAFFDADGDGDMDLFLGAARQNGVCQFLTNDGTGHFTIVSTPPLPTTWVAGSDATDAQAIDLNGDGRLDLLVTYTIGANGAKAYVQALINQGGGNFSDETNLRIPASFQGISNALGIILADINGDGFKDILYSQGTTTSLALNDGTGHFVVMPAGTIPISASDGSYAVGDVNGDGHLDFMVSTGRSNSSEFYRTDLWTDPGTTRTGSSGDDGLMGDARAETFSGLAGNDVIFAGAGDDTLNGGPGNDVLDGGAGWDQAVFSGNYASYAITRNSNGSVTISGPDGSDTLTHVELAVFADRTAQIGGIVLTTANVSSSRNQTLTLSSLFTANDIDGNAITAYQLWDSTNDPLSGHFVINGVAQAERAVINITAAQLAQTSFVTGKVSDSLQIRAYDGNSWSATDSAQWAPFTVTVPPNNPPVLTTSNKTAAHGQSFTLSSLMTVSDPDGDAITSYQLWDATNTPGSGHFVINGVAQAERALINVTAAQLAQTSFVAGFVNDNLQIRAFDGTAWSAADTAQWAPFSVSVPVNNAPVLSTSNKTATNGQSFALSNLLTVSDPDGDAITAYQLWDATNTAGSGHFVINGVAQPERALINITAAQVAQTSFVAGTVGDSLQIRAFDGNLWSALDTAQWAPFTISPPVNNPPVVSTSNKNASHGQSFALSSLLTVSDPDGDAITAYQLWDATADPASGSFVINGVVQPGRTLINLTPGQVAQTTFVAGTVSDSLQIRAFDGNLWSASDSAQWAPFTVNVPANSPPVLTTTNKSASHGQSFALSSLLTVSDPDGDAITAYQLWDATNTLGSGHFVINGVAQAERAVIDVTAAQLAQTSFVAGTVNDNLQIRAYDGNLWSALDSAQWAPFTVSVPAYTLPVVATTDVSGPHGQSLSLSSLFTASDPDGDTITAYQLWDATTTSGSGHFVINGVAQAERTVINITAAQVAQTSFLAGNTGVVDSLQIRAFDGYNWSAADSAQWSPFHVTAT